MASKTRAFLKNDNKDFDNILDSYLSLSETSAETVAGGITAASSATLGFKKGAMLVSCYPDAAQEAKAGAGACNVTSFYTAITTDGADAMTLAAGTELGQLKKIQLIGDSGDAIPGAFGIGKAWCNKNMHLDMTDYQFTRAIITAYLKSNKGNFEESKKQIRMNYGVLKLYTLDELEHRNQ